jgi:hypothetical protein
MGYNVVKVWYTEDSGDNAAHIFNSGQRIKESYTSYRILKRRIRGEFIRYVEIRNGKEEINVNFKVTNSRPDVRFTGQDYIYMWGQQEESLYFGGISYQ